MLRFHAQTAGSTLTAQQPEVNAIRVALQAMAAVLGGTQSLHTNSRDEALGLPTEESAQLALRTQQVIAYESGVNEFPDPFGGSDCIEKLTDEIEAGARTYIHRIDAMGGTLRAIRLGFIQSEIHNAAYQFQKGVESGKQIVVGVNRFQGSSKTENAPRTPDFASERKQIDRLRQVRASRSSSAVETVLSRLEATAQSTGNLIDPILNCCREYCSVGEISDRLRRVFGEHRES